MICQCVFVGSMLAWENERSELRGSSSGGEINVGRRRSLSLAQRLG